MPQKDFSNNPNWKPTGLGSTGTLEYNRDGKEFKAISIDYNSAEFHKTIDAVKARVFGECLDKGMYVSEAVEIVQKTESDLSEVANDVISAEEAFQEIDQRAKKQVEEKIVEIADDAPVAEKRRAQRENIDVISTTVRQVAQEKIRVIDEKIKLADERKAEVSARLCHIPDAKETVITAFESITEGLEATRNVLVYVVKNPLETADLAYQAGIRLKDKVVEKIVAIDNGIDRSIEFVRDHSAEETVDFVASKLSQMYNGDRCIIMLFFIVFS